MIQDRIKILKLISMYGYGVGLWIVKAIGRHIIHYCISMDFNIFQLRISLKQLWRIHSIFQLTISPKHILFETLNDISTTYIDGVLYLGIRHFVPPLPICTTLPACRHLDSLGVFLCLLHLLSHIQVIHADSLLLSLVSLSCSLLANELKARPSVLALHKLPWVHTVQQVLHHSVSHFLCTREVNMKEVAHAFPEPLQSLLHTLQSTQSLHRVQLIHAASNLTSLTSQTFSTTTARIRSYHLVSNLVIRFQFRIAFLHLVPYRRALHQAHHVLPFFMIIRLQRARPQMSILMYRRLRGGYPWVIVYLSTNSKAVGLTILCFEEPHIVSNLRVFLVKDNIILCSILTATASVVSRVFDADKAKRR